MNSTVEEQTTNEGQSKGINQTTLQQVEQLRERTAGNKLEKLVAWFPNPEKQQEVEAMDDEAKATFTVEVLGHIIDWEDKIERLHINRSQDGQIAAVALGLTYSQAVEFKDLIEQLSPALNDYADYLIGDLLNWNFSLIASKMKTAGQALGFHKRMFNKTEEVEDMNIILSNGQSIEDRYSAILLLSDKIPRDAAVESANFDPNTNKLTLKLS